MEDKRIYSFLNSDNEVMKFSVRKPTNKEIEDSDAEVEAENNKIETEDLSQYTEEESDTVEEELESDDIKVDEE